MSWQITQMMDVGTDNSIVARLSVGLFDLLQIAQLPKEKKEAIQEYCLEIMRSLVQAEKAAKPLMDEIHGIEAKLATEGAKTQNGGRVIETPGVLLLDNTRVFLKFSKQALQHLAKALGILLEKDFNGPHFHKILERANERLGENHVVTRLLKEDQDWLKEINALRNEDEHPQSGKPFTSGFSISRLQDGKFLIDVPRFFNNAPILNSLEVYIHNLLTFAEELLAHMLEEFFPKMVRVYDIPEDQRNRSNPVRYRIGLREGIKLPPHDPGGNKP